VDVNLNLVKNLLTSLVEQRGEPGPSSSMLSQVAQCNKERTAKGADNEQCHAARKRKYGNCNERYM
jgi:hypothetical protein